MRTKINRFISALMFLSFGAGCSAGRFQTELISYKTASDPTLTEPPLTTTIPVLNSTNIPDPDVEKKFTYFLDQAAIDQYCLEFPMLTIYKAKDIGGQFYVGVRSRITFLLFLQKMVVSTQFSLPSSLKVTY